MGALASPPNSARSGERRRNPRLKLSSVTYVKLNDGNGGILVNIGTGGLRVQAFAKLDPGQDLVLSFRFFDTDEMLTVTGRTTWLATTGKAAGIRFKDLPAETERRIAEWIASQQIGTNEVPPNVDFPAKSVPAANENRIPPARLPNAPIPSRNDALDPHPGPVNVAAGDPRVRVNVRDGVLSTPETPHVPDLSPPSKKSAEPIHVEMRSPAPTVNSIAVPPEPARPILRAEPARSYELFRGSEQGPQTAPASSLPVISAPSVAVAGSRRRTLLIAGLIACVGAFALILAKGNFARHLEITVFNAKHSFSAISPAPDSEPERAARRRAAVLFLAKIRKMLPGLNDNSLSESSTVNAVSVWTDKQNGFYYCIDSPNFAKLQPGSVETQGEALQRGYQPKLGTYCR